MISNSFSSSSHHTGSNEDKALIHQNEEKAKGNLDKSLLKLEILKKRASSIADGLDDLEMNVSPHKRVKFDRFYPNHYLDEDG